MPQATWCNRPLARQDVKERESRDHCRCRSGDSYRIALVSTVVSTLTRFNSAGRIKRIFMPVSIVARGICSAPPSPRRLRQRVMLEGSTGIRC